MTTATYRLLIPVCGLMFMFGCEKPAPVETGSVPAAGAKDVDPTSELSLAKAVTPIDLTKVSLTAEQMENIKKLPEADQALALEQKVCPSSEENLGEMGVPIKMEVKGQTVFICCGGCKGDLETDPDTMLAKLGKKPTAPATP
jgi:hypothetical protein